MKTKSDHKKLFFELEKWSNRKDAYSINEFLKVWEMAFSNFESIANNNPKFMKIWGIVESRVWENIKEALYTKSLPRSQIGEYIREGGLCGYDDPESYMKSLEETKTKMDLWDCVMNDNTDKDTQALFKVMLECRMMTQGEYNEALNDVY